MPQKKEQYEKRMLAPSLSLSGKSTDHIWAMEDVEGYIGLRLDCGDAGAVYFTKEQAKKVIENLLAML